MRHAPSIGTLAHENGNAARHRGDAGYGHGVRVIHASAEVAPFSKTGGLGDVVGALPAAQAAYGHDVLVVSPWYPELGGVTPVKPMWIGDIDVPFAGGLEPVGVGTLERDGVLYAFVGHADYSRPDPYGYPDDVRRFARFCRAVPPVAARLGFVPDLVHAHDWHAGLLPVLLERGWHLPAGFPGRPSVATVHNVQFQGVAPLAHLLHWARLPLELVGSHLEHEDRGNMLRAAVGFADLVTTVSPSYATELTEPGYGFGLDTTFRALGRRLAGILNGLDVRVWDPARDPHLEATYDAADTSGKERCRSALLEELGLDDGGPLLGVVSRLADQKGIDLLLEALPALLEQGWRLALLGRGDAKLEAAARDAATAAPEQVAVTLAHDEPLAHRVYAGSDALAVPSRFEPCGLSQMIAQRYGTLPLVRATGGLRDTVEHERDGFVFEEASAEELALAAGNARGMWGTQAWRSMQQRAMAHDRSWRASARDYLERYREAIGEAP